MSDQGKRLMFLDSLAKKYVGKKWRIIFPVTKFFADFFSTDEILCRLFSSDKVLFQLTANVTKNPILYVARVLDTPLVKFSVYTFNMFTFTFFRRLLA